MSESDVSVSKWSKVRIVLTVLATLVLFIFSLDLMVSSLQNLGKNVLEPILFATANPINGLLIGLMITAMVQSSSATTSLTVALVASGSLNLEGAVPIIMGANIGTTITSSIVALGFINRVKEFKRATAAGVYHDFFNILTAIVLFPLEYYFGFLSRLAEFVSTTLFLGDAASKGKVSGFSISWFDRIIHFLQDFLPPWLMVILGMVSLFASIFLFRRIISDLLQARSPEKFSRFFFRNDLKSFSWGVLTTAAIRSSTITTSVVVPLVAKRVVTFRQAAPFILGANIGTTITALIAAFLNNGSSSAISIALVHIFFNLIGVMLFFPIPFLRSIPMDLAQGFGKLTVKYRLSLIVYLLITFFFVPFTLLYINQNVWKVYWLTYSSTENSTTSYYRIKARMNTQALKGDWASFDGKVAEPGEVARHVIPVMAQGKRLFIGDQMVVFGSPGNCWDGTDNQGNYQACIDKILPGVTFGEVTFDSVYSYRVDYHTPVAGLHQYQLSAAERILLKHEIIRDGIRIKLDSLIDLREE